MTQMMQGPVVAVKPQANVYTVMLLVAILAMLIASVTVVLDLSASYDVPFGDIFSSQIGGSAAK